MFQFKYFVDHRTSAQVPRRTPVPQMVLFPESASSWCSPRSWRSPFHSKTATAHLQRVVELNPLVHPRTTDILEMFLHEYGQPSVYGLEHTQDILSAFKFKRLESIADGISRLDRARIQRSSPIKVGDSSSLAKENLVNGKYVYCHLLR